MEKEILDKSKKKEERQINKNNDNDIKEKLN